MKCDRNGNGWNDAGIEKSDKIKKMDIISNPYFQISIVLIFLVLFFVCLNFYNASYPFIEEEFSGIYHGYITTDEGNSIRTVHIGNNHIKGVALSDYKIQMLSQFIGKDITLILVTRHDSLMNSWYRYVGMYENY